MILLSNISFLWYLLAFHFVLHYNVVIEIVHYIVLIYSGSRSVFLLGCLCLNKRIVAYCFIIVYLVIMTWNFFDGA